jgi:hypothetical protein
MANHKLSILQRTHDKTGWHRSTQFTDDDIKNVKVNDSKSGKSLNAIPSPLARLHLIDAAFSLLYQEELQHSSTVAYANEKLVSDCLDVFELVFNWNYHIREGKDLKIVSWNREEETEKLQKEFVTEKRKAEEQLRRSNPADKLLNVTEIKGFRENLVADTLNLFLNSKPFNEFNEIHIIKFENKVIGGTSPLTGFFTTPNDLSNLALINPNTSRKYFSKPTAFVDRDDKVKKFIHDFIVKEGSDIFPDKLAICKYLDFHSQAINHRLTLNLVDLNPTSISIFNNTIKLKSSKERSSSDYFEPCLVKLNYKINEQCFYIPTFNKERKHDYLMPLTIEFLEDFGLSQISNCVTINEKDPSTVEVIIKKDDKKISKTYLVEPIHEKDGKLIDLNESHSMKFNLGLFPFLKMKKDGPGAAYNDYYRIMLVCQDLMYRYSNNDFKIEFGIDKRIIDPVTATNYSIVQEDRTVLENPTLVGSTYFSLNFCFDFIQITLPNLHNKDIKGLIIPAWIERDLDENQIDFAIDFGTTTTFVAYTDDPNHQVTPKKFELSEKQIPVALFSQPKKKLPEIKTIDCFEQMDFLEFPEIQKQEFVPSVINDERYSFPLRTAVYEKKSIPLNKKKSLLNSNISFSYQKHLDRVSEGSNEYITNLKWNVKTNSKYRESVEVFVEELFQLLKLKALLNNSDPRKSNISWFSPLSFTPGAQFEYEQIWKNKFQEVFKSDPEKQLKNITESEAPYYYYSKGAVAGEDQITDTSSVLTLDIGGGTTDIMYFRDNTPKLGTSVHFGANILWGEGYSEFKNTKTNGIYNSLKDELVKVLKSTELKSLNEKLMKEDSDFGADEILNFWILNEDKTGILQKLNKGDFKLSYLLHFTSLIYHSCKLLKHYSHPAPRCIVFTGNGSKYLDLIQSKEYVSKICGYFIRHIFTDTEKNPQVILPKVNRKEATCFGGLYQPFNLKRQFETRNYLGFESKSESYTKYSDLDIQKELIFDRLEGSFGEFLRCFFNMNNTSELSFRNHFGIETNLVAVKNYLLLKTKENIKAGYELRRKSVSDSDEITDSLFFYPLIGLIYNINKLTKERMKEFVPRTVYNAPVPDGENGFDLATLSIERKTDSIFTITVDETNPDFGELSIIDDVQVHKRALAAINSYVKIVCEFDEFPDNTHQSIRTINQGKVQKTNNLWSITEKIKVEFF